MVLGKKRISSSGNQPVLSEPLLTDEMRREMEDDMDTLRAVPPAEAVPAPDMDTPRAAPPPENLSVSQISEVDPDVGIASPSSMSSNTLLMASSEAPLSSSDSPTLLASIDPDVADDVEAVLEHYGRSSVANPGPGLNPNNEAKSPARGVFDPFAQRDFTHDDHDDRTYPLLIDSDEISEGVFNTGGVSNEAGKLRKGNSFPQGGEAPLRQSTSEKLTKVPRGRSSTVSGGNGLRRRSLGDVVGVSVMGAQGASLGVPNMRSSRATQVVTRALITRKYDIISGIWKFLRYTRNCLCGLWVLLFLFEIMLMWWYVAGVLDMYEHIIVEPNAVNLGDQAGSNLSSQMNLVERKKGRTSSMRGLQTTAIHNVRTGGKTEIETVETDTIMVGQANLTPEAILSQMTTEEKKHMLGGVWSYGQYTGIVKGVPRLGVPPLLMNDGPQGYNVFPLLFDPATVLPIGFLPITAAVDTIFFGHASLDPPGPTALYVQNLACTAFTNTVNGMIGVGSDSNGGTTSGGWSFLNSIGQALLSDKTRRHLKITVKPHADSNKLIETNRFCGSSDRMGNRGFGEIDPMRSSCNRIGTTTAFPAALTQSATFSKKTVRRLGKAIGQEFIEKGANMVLGPAVNMHRIPYGSRNFEFLPGEDALLGSVMTEELVRSLRRPCGTHDVHDDASRDHTYSNHNDPNRERQLMVVLKHWIGNEDETKPSAVLSPNYDDGIEVPNDKTVLERLSNKLTSLYWLTHSLFFGTISGATWLNNYHNGLIKSTSPEPSYSANIPEQAMMEIYSKPFKAGMRAGIAAIMCSYNRVNNTASCENEKSFKVLQELAEEAGSLVGLNRSEKSDPNPYFVMSDWGVATDNGTAALHAGMDVEMPTSFRTADALNRLAEESNPLLNEKIMKILRVLQSHNRLGYESAGSSGSDPTKNLWRNVTSTEHKLLVRDVAAEGMVLLKNGKSEEASSVAPIVNSTAAFQVAAPVLPISLTSPIRLNLFGCSDGSTFSASGGSGAVTSSYSASLEDGVLDLLQDISSKNTTSVELNVYDEDHNHLRSSQYGITPNSSQSETSTQEGAETASVMPSIETISVVCLHGPPTPDEVDYNLDLPLGRTPSGKMFDWQKLMTTNNTENRIITAISAPGVFSITDEIEDNSDAILVGFYAGAQAGYAVSEILFGLNSPRGRLPVTLPYSRDTRNPNRMGRYIQFTPEQYPGLEIASPRVQEGSEGASIDVSDSNADKIREQGYNSKQIPAPADVRGLQTTYSENLAIGYRWYHANKIKPAYAFGFGLSYSKFSYDGGSRTSEKNSSGRYLRGNSNPTVSFSDVKLSEMVVRNETKLRLSFRVDLDGDSGKMKILSRRSTMGTSKSSNSSESKFESSVSGVKSESRENATGKKVTVVPQLYIQHYDRPFRELVGFEKFIVSDGEFQKIFSFTSYETYPFQIWSVERGKFVFPPIKPQIFLATSAEDPGVEVGLVENISI